MVFVCGEKCRLSQRGTVRFVVFQQSFPDTEILVGDKDVVRLLLLFQPASLHRDERQQEFSVGHRLDVPCRDGQGLPVFVSPGAAFVEKDRAAGIVYHVNVVFIHRETPEVLIFPFAMPEAVDDESHRSVRLENHDFAVPYVSDINQTVSEIHFVYGA